jgi:hypothetical protein
MPTSQHSVLNNVKNQKNPPVNFKCLLKEANESLDYNQNAERLLFVLSSNHLKDPSADISLSCHTDKNTVLKHSWASPLNEIAASSSSAFRYQEF